jgi:hypothetical protein
MTMDQRELLITLAASLILALLLLLALQGSDLRFLNTPDSAVANGPAGHAGPTVPAATASPTPQLSQTVSPASPRNVGQERVVLLHDSRHPAVFDANIRRLASYYGLQCADIPIDVVPFSSAALRGDDGAYIRLVAISPGIVNDAPADLSEQALKELKQFVEAGGSVLIAVRDAMMDSALLSSLTDGAIVGTNEPQDRQRDWLVNPDAREVAGVFAGQSITVPVSSGRPFDLALRLGNSQAVTALISAGDDQGTGYVVVGQYRSGAGSVFVHGGEQTESLEQQPFSNLYYYDYYFSQIVPLMLVMRYAVGDRAWHSPGQYANLTIDDPPLTEPSWGGLSYRALLRDMQAHNYHTTIAFVPANWAGTEPAVAQLFLAHPDRFSLVQHGNEHDSYEFYKYSLEPGDRTDDPALRARPLAEQRASIAQGLARMQEHTLRTGVPFDRVMIVPYGISPEPTLAVLKQFNFLGVVSALSEPLGASRPQRWDYDMYPSGLDFANFPIVGRRPHDKADALPSLPRDLFIGKPALLYGHSGDFAPNVLQFGALAERINGLAGSVEWHNLGYILNRLYWQKNNADGSTDIRMFTSHAVWRNESGATKTYHLMKEETLNVPIAGVTVNGARFPYSVEAGWLKIDMAVPAGVTVEVAIAYQE